jgi:hypothetical protein
MAKRLTVRSKKATPFVWNRTTMIHLARDPKLTFGVDVAALCGRIHAIGVGGGARPVDEFLNMHQSAVCSVCRAILEHDGKVE